MKYKFIEDLKSDVMFEAYGKNLNELFENAALALLSVICDLKKVKPEKKERFEIKGTDLGDLMFNWLSAVIAISETENMFFSKVKVIEISSKKIVAELYGEPISPEKGGTVVKAVTYYGFNLEKTKKGYILRASLDI